MSLHDRLNTLRRQAGAGAPAEPGAAPASEAAPEQSSGPSSGPSSGDERAATLAQLRARLDRMGVGGTGRSQAAREPAPRISPAELAGQLQGRLLDAHLVEIDRRLAPERAHGRYPLALAQEGAGPFWPDAARVGYIDTETTGLAGGTGTVAFLVGLATVEDGALRLRQWLMTAFAGEAALLQAVDEALAGCEHLVSYNGKTFDLPLLRDRRRMQRRPDHAEPAHTDFLHPVRSLFGHHWPDCRLRTAEERLLGLAREDDLPGSEAPWAWKEYLNFGRSHNLQRVVRHNTDDILSLALLGPVLARALEDPPAFAASVEGGARLRERLEGPGAARPVLEAGRDHLTDQGRLWLAREYRRAGAIEQAVALWEPLAEQGQAEAIEALAKYHEHQRRDWARALDYACRLGPAPEVQRRCARLRQRLARA